jgi:excisionase family DNA binding protein
MEKPTIERLVYSIPEAAHALHCSKSLVYDLVKAEKLPHVHLSEKRVIIPKEVLEHYLRTQSEGGNERR